MSKPLILALIAGSSLLAGCTQTTRSNPVDVTRFHLGAPLAERTSVAIEPGVGSMDAGPEFSFFADAVAGELNRVGYVPTPAGQALTSGYIAAVSFKRDSLGAYRERPPVSIGLGGGGISGGRGGGVGLGGGLSFGLGGKTRNAYVNELSVQLRRRSDNSTVWEGRAVSQTVGDQPADTASRLSRALFKDFPGESGVTITVK